MNHAKVPSVSEKVVDAVADQQACDPIHRNSTNLLRQPRRSDQPSGKPISRNSGKMWRHICRSDYLPVLTVFRSLGGALLGAAGFRG